MSEHNYEGYSLPTDSYSYWRASTEQTKYKRLEDNLDTEVVVVGAGITGITTAYLLAKRGIKVVLLEAGNVLEGTTAHTTAKITVQHDLIYDELIAHFGAEQALQYYKSNEEALQFITEQMETLQIECDYKQEDAYLYTCSAEQLPLLEKEWLAYEQLGIKGEFLKQAPLPFATEGAIKLGGQAQFHPLKYVTRLLEEAVKLGVEVYEQVTAVTVEQEQRAKVMTDRGFSITCSYVVACTHYPFVDGMRAYFSRMYADRSYVICGKPTVPFHGGMHINVEMPKRSIRSVQVKGQEMLLIGGEGHKVGQGNMSTMQNYKILAQFAAEQFGIEEVAYRWSAQDLITLDKIPFIGSIAGDDSNILIATGFKKWGMTTGTLAAMMFDLTISGKASFYRDLYKPDRFHADPDIKSFVSINVDTAKQLFTGKLESLVGTLPQVDELALDTGKVVEVDGKRAGAYRDKEGKLFVVDTTCTHMGCEVNWNDGERSWDCPCHGSRFSYKGDVLEGPAQKPLARWQ
ncbi:FAD-dependent oxidoreductase [Paenibacillus yanchengensis]|uniref:FAD-dependent oxidoreductase n=1 Tax=Paenibacillus yanchengensis TaxID=2035833 RepID=A0ABW4YGG9_9BACL